MGITDNSLKYHLATAKQNGITRTEIAEIITHIAFYAGWPKAWAAFNLAKEVWNDDIPCVFFFLNLYLPHLVAMYIFT